MSVPNKKNITPSGGFLHEIALRIKLVLRLMGDNRVNPLVKIIPIASVAYVLNPIDIPGPIDDAAVFGVAMYLFMELCPPEVVQEHMDNLRGVHLDNDMPDEGEVIDVEFEEEK